MSQSRPSPAHENVHADREPLHHRSQQFDFSLDLEAGSGPRESHCPDALAEASHEVPAQDAQEPQKPSMTHQQEAITTFEDSIDRRSPEAREQMPRPYARDARRPDVAAEIAGRVFHRVADQYKKPQELTSQQQKAIELLLTGQRESKVAEELGIHRSTLWRWRQKDEDFRRTLDLARYQAFHGATDRLRELVPRSLEILEEQLEAGNHQAALRILRLAQIDRSVRETTHWPTMPPFGR